MKNVMALVIVVFFSSLHSWAGDEAGNGGDALVCYSSSGKINSVEMLDTYEGREYYKMPNDLGQGQSYQEKLKYYLQRIEKLDQARAAILKTRANTFFEEAELKAGIVLEDIPDSKHLYIPSGCKVEQIAVQVNPTFPNEKRYTISKDLWDRLDEMGKAVLVIHELIYREAVVLGHTHSKNARYLTGLFTSVSFGDLDSDKYIELLEKAKFKFNINMFLELKVSQPKYYTNGQLKSGFVSSGSILLGGREHELKKESPISFSSKGVPTYATLEGIQNIRIGQREYRVEGRINFDPNGGIFRLGLADTTSIEIGGTIFTIDTEKGATLDFTPSGKIERIYFRPKQPPKLQLSSLELVGFDKELMVIEFEANENIRGIKASLATVLQSKEVILEYISKADKAGVLVVQLHSASAPVSLKNSNGFLTYVKPHNQYCINEKQLVLSCE